MSLELAHKLGLDALLLVLGSSESLYKLLSPETGRSKGRREPLEERWLQRPGALLVLSRGTAMLLDSC